MTERQPIITKLEHNMCLFILCIYVLYGESCPWQSAWPAFALPWISTFDEKKLYTAFLWWKITKYMLFNTIADSLEVLTDSFSTISAHSNNHFYRYKMSLKQILHDKNFIIEIIATRWEIDLIFFVNIWNADIIEVGLINLHIYFYFFLMALKISSDM